MALIECPECEATISSSASACPQCGKPIAKQARTRSRTRTIERTGKGVKLAKLVGWLLVLFGLYICFGGHNVNVGAPILFTGVAVIFLSKIAGWWGYG